MKKIIILIILLFIPISILAEDIDGFRGIKWGTNIKDIPDMVYDHTDPSYGGIKMYSKKNDNFAIGSAQLDKIFYAFWQDQFSSAWVYTSGYVNFGGLKDATFEKFGSGHKPNRYIEKYYWFNLDKTTISLRYDEITKNGIFIISSKDISKKQEAYDKQKAKEGAKGF